MMKTPWTAIGFLAAFTTATALQAASGATRLVPILASENSTGSTLAKRTPDVIYVPTSQTVVEKMLQMAEIKPGDVVYDLGCGDGRIVVTAAKKYGVKAFGFDIDPERIKESQENVRTNKIGHLVTIRQADIFTLDLSKANVVTLYLLPSLNVKLIPQLEKLKPGSRIVSHSFDMAGIRPVEVYQENGVSIYKWITPLERMLSPTGREIGDPLKNGK